MLFLDYSSFDFYNVWYDVTAVAAMLLYEQVGVSYGTRAYLIFRLIFFSFFNYNNFQFITFFY